MITDVVDSLVEYISTNKRVENRVAEYFTARFRWLFIILKTVTVIIVMQTFLLLFVVSRVWY
jgi:hypothetical protein